jgi:ABC-type histidine transport system ATPase subunit
MSAMPLKLQVDSIHKRFGANEVLKGIRCAPSTANGWRSFFQEA